MTLRVEQALWEHTNKMNVFGASEVQFGFNKDGTNGFGIVDYVTFENDGTIRCYEIKTSVSDLKHGREPTFVGDYNYWVVTPEVYDWMKRHKTFGHWYAGIFVFNDDSLQSVKRAKKKVMYFSEKARMMESMVRSLNREVKKYYKLLAM